METTIVHRPEPRRSADLTNLEHFAWMLQLGNSYDAALTLSSYRELMRELSQLLRSPIVHQIGQLNQLLLNQGHIIFPSKESIVLPVSVPIILPIKPFSTSRPETCFTPADTETTATFPSCTPPQTTSPNVAIHPVSPLPFPEVSSTPALGTVQISPALPLADVLESELSTSCQSPQCVSTSPLSTEASLLHQASEEVFSQDSTPASSAPSPVTTTSPVVSEVPSAPASLVANQIQTPASCNRVSSSQMPSISPCSIITESIGSRLRKNPQKVQCKICKQWYHVFCLNLDNSEYVEKTFMCCGHQQCQEAKNSKMGKIFFEYYQMKQPRPRPQEP
ncbi:hypothetical protein GCK72_023129 [Caenorhabditis remanei]|uniref:Zinc finger PHD-type domain-containing protein n=1 Tax=Caenorhabditis remanei TaxID=31234 RepID=A0A6A5FVW7_CAERE|nr:hypothetical protein GCK72_023129 [Caenorhabditis remanei]KAF1746672.1 hypothetical protein GCK72_023129 [Caenorhabditis remanei]